MKENMNSAELKTQRTVDDFSFLCEGDIEPTLNKKIHTLILRTNDFIVYLDDELFVEWSNNDFSRESVIEFDKIVNRMSNLEINSMHLLSKKQLLPFRRLLGESIARILNSKNTDAANKILDDAEEFLKNRSVERARIWYLNSSFCATLFFLFFASVIWGFRNYLNNLVPPEFVQIITLALLASIGALISIISRVSSISVNAFAGLQIHVTEGVLRIFVGIIGALFLLILVKADILLGFLGNKDNISFLIAISIVAGFSEQLVPNLIKKIGDSII